MKIWIAAALFLSSTTMAELPSFSFPVSKIELPATPLIDRARASAPVQQPMDDAAKWFRQTTVKRAPKVEHSRSGMPIVRPPENIDPKMVHAPRTDIDFKMIVKTPTMAARGDPEGPKPLGDPKRRGEEPAPREKR